MSKAVVSNPLRDNSSASSPSPHPTLSAARPDPDHTVLVKPTDEVRIGRKVHPRDDRGVISSRGVDDFKPAERVAVSYISACELSGDCPVLAVHRLIRPTSSHFSCALAVVREVTGASSAPAGSACQAAAGSWRSKNCSKSPSNVAEARSIVSLSSSWLRRARPSATSTDTTASTPTAGSTSVAAGQPLSRRSSQYRRCTARLRAASHTWKRKDEVVEDDGKLEVASLERGHNQREVGHVEVALIQPAHGPLFVGSHESASKVGHVGDNGRVRPLDAALSESTAQLLKVPAEVLPPAPPVAGLACCA